MELILSALVLGLMGSFHCAGMCGPIALSLPLGGNNIYRKIFGGTLYNIGRTITYGIMGAFFGLIGQGFHMVGFQKWVSIVMGSLMILSIFIPSVFQNLNAGKGLPFAASVRKGISKMFAKQSLSGLFIIGLLNGLLPCGLVYLAIAGAIGTANTFQGVLFMVAFGLGTLPLMLAISLAGNLVTLQLRNRINKIIPYIVVVVGIIFILRGLSLGIPLVSPPEKKLDPNFHKGKIECESPKETAKSPCCGGK